MELGVGGNYVFEVVVAQGRSRADAIRDIHHACTFRCKQIEVEAQLEVVEEVKAEVNQKLFLDTCLACDDPEVAAADADLGLNMPAKARPTICKDFLKKYAEDLLVKTSGKVRSDWKKKTDLEGQCEKPWRRECDSSSGGSGSIV